MVSSALKVCGLDARVGDAADPHPGDPHIGAVGETVDAVEPGGQPEPVAVAHHRPAAAVQHGIAEEQEGDGEDHRTGRDLGQAASLHRSRRPARHDPGVQAS